MEFPKKPNKKNIEKYWNNKASEILLNKTIVEVEYLPEDEADRSMWGKRPVCFKLNDGTWVIPQSDDEGNDGGALYYNRTDLDDDILPVL